MWNDSTDRPSIVIHVSFLTHVVIASSHCENCAISFNPKHEQRTPLRMKLQILAFFIIIGIFCSVQP